MTAILHILVHPFAGNGRPLLRVSACALILSGLSVLLLGMTGRFLPHDERFLGMTAAELCALHGCRIVHFMIHDRISFGGALIAVGTIYLWLVEAPLRRREVWAWWALLLSGSVGFVSFFAYLGYGYLDTWHGLATLALLPCFALGLMHERNRLTPLKRPGCLPQAAAGWPWLGRACLLATAAGLVFGGFTILVVGVTCVFVPQDLAYMGVSAAEMHAFNPRLVPLIAHDRAGFGGAVCCCGIALFFCVWRGTPSRSLWCTLALVGMAGFGSGIGAHPAVGYTDPIHLGPAVLGALVYMTGLAMTCRPMFQGARRCHDVHAVAA